MNYAISAWMLFLVGVFAEIAFAQTTPSAEDIMKVWLASPHANAETEAFRHWDTEGEIPGQCAVCHSTTGMVDYLASSPTLAGVIGHPVPTGTTVECAACHDPGAEALRDVLMPSGQVVKMSRGSAVCAVCHQGRASADTVCRSYPRGIG